MNRVIAWVVVALVGVVGAFGAGEEPRTDVAPADTGTALVPTAISTYYGEHFVIIVFFSGIREGLAMPREPALLGHRSAGSGLVGEAMDGEAQAASSEQRPGRP